MKIEKLEIIKNEGAGNLVFSRGVDYWQSQINDEFIANNKNGKYQGYVQLNSGHTTRQKSFS